MNEEALAQDYLVDYLEADTELMAVANAVTLSSVGPGCLRRSKVDRLGSSDLRSSPMGVGRPHVPRPGCAPLGKDPAPPTGHR